MLLSYLFSCFYTFNFKGFSIGSLYLGIPFLYCSAYTHLLFSCPHAQYSSDLHHFHLSMPGICVQPFINVFIQRLHSHLKLISLNDVTPTSHISTNRHLPMDHLPTVIPIMNCSPHYLYSTRGYPISTVKIKVTV